MAAPHQKAPKPNQKEKKSRKDKWLDVSLPAKYVVTQPIVPTIIPMSKTPQERKTSLRRLFSQSSSCSAGNLKISGSFLAKCSHLLHPQITPTTSQKVARQDRISASLSLSLTL